MPVGRLRLLCWLPALNDEWRAKADEGRDGVRDDDVNAVFLDGSAGVKISPLLLLLLVLLLSSYKNASQSKSRSFNC